MPVIVLRRWRNMLDDQDRLQLLAVDWSSFPGRQNVLIADRSSHGAFFIHYFLNLCQKQSRPVLLIGLSQSLSHYKTVGHKLGGGTGPSQQGQQQTERHDDGDRDLLFVDGLHLLAESVSCSSSAQTLSPRPPNPFLQLLTGDSTALIELIGGSFQRLAALAEETVPAKAAPVVIIDDLSILHSAGLPTKDLLLLINRILELVTSGKTKGSLIILFHLDKEDERAEEICAFLTHLSSLQIEVSDLQSGYCKDVHGQVQTQWRDAHDTPRLSLTKHAQFKLSDKGIELFAPGMSAAVL